jgi:hypothetical protein
MFIPVPGSRFFSRPVSRIPDTGKKSTGSRIRNAGDSISRLPCFLFHVRTSPEVCRVTLFLILHYFQEEEEDLPEEPIVPVIRQQDNKARTSKERRISEDVERSRRIAAEVGTLFMCILPPSPPPPPLGGADPESVGFGTFFHDPDSKIFPDSDLVMK